MTTARVIVRVIYRSGASREVDYPLQIDHATALYERLVGIAWPAFVREWEQVRREEEGGG